MCLTIMRKAVVCQLIYGCGIYMLGTYDIASYRPSDRHQLFVLVYVFLTYNGYTDVVPSRRRLRGRRGFVLGLITNV